MPKTKSEPANRPKLPSKLADPAPWVMPAPVRGLMVPVLGAARLGTLAEEMKRHGFTTLFYPILLGGYATFPSGTFALHPALRGEDGWSAAVGARRPRGSRWWAISTNCLGRQSATTLTG